jgi:hypothetical protein
VWVLVVAMLFVLVVAALVMLYVAFPHRGERVPRAGWLGEAMGRAVGKAPVMKDGDADLTRR